MTGGNPLSENVRRAVQLKTAQAALFALLLGLCSRHRTAMAQEQARPTHTTETTEQKVQRLSEAVAQTQQQMDAYQKQLQQLQGQLAALQRQLSAEKDMTGGGDAEATELARSVDEIRERQAITESQVATHDQSKVETDSSYPLKISGLVLFNGFANTKQVDAVADPTYVLPGSGSTGLSLRQTQIGLDARGPRLFGASSHADVRVDFFAGSQSGYMAGGVLRLRTAHATLDWRHTKAYVELDRLLIAPNTPTSIVSSAQPEFAWSGNLWTWNPQIGVSHHIALTESKRLVLQAAIADVADPHLPGVTTNPLAISQTERSRWPGTEARIAVASGEPGAGPELGIGGYFSPHETTDNARFNAWAGTIDLRVPLGKRLEMTANGYRGQALGGLGGGGFVDYLYQNHQGSEVTVPLDDVGGWTQLKSKLSERLQFNGGYGIDNPFASQIRYSLAPTGSLPYAGLVRNRSASGNVIYSPSAYLLFSLEYRRLWTNYATGPTSVGDVIGVGAGYRF